MSPMVAPPFTFRTLAASASATLIIIIIIIIHCSRPRCRGRAATKRASSWPLDPTRLISNEETIRYLHSSVVIK